MHPQNVFSLLPGRLVYVFRMTIQPSPYSSLTAQTTHLAQVRVIWSVPFEKLFKILTEEMINWFTAYYFRSVCLSVCLFVCAEFFSAVIDPISIKLGHMLYVWV